MSKGQIYLEEFNIRVNGQKKIVEALIFENEDGKITITDTVSNEYVEKYIPTSEGVFYITNKDEMYYLGLTGNCQKIKANLQPTTQEVFVSLYGEKVLYSNYGEHFAAGPEGITMELHSEYNSYEFIGSNNEDIYFFDSRDNEFFKVTYDSNEKEVIYKDVEKVKIIGDKIIYVIKCDYPANSTIFITDLPNTKNNKEVIVIHDCERVIDFNYSNNMLFYSCEFYFSDDMIRLYSININDDDEATELHKWKKKYYFEEDKIVLEDSKITLYIQTELQKYEKWEISYDDSLFG